MIDQFLYLSFASSSSSSKLVVVLIPAWERRVAKAQCIALRLLFFFLRSMSVPSYPKSLSKNWITCDLGLISDSISIPKVSIVRELSRNLRMELLQLINVFLENLDRVSLMYVYWRNKNFEYNYEDNLKKFEIKKSLINLFYRLNVTDSWLDARVQHFIESPRSTLKEERNSGIIDDVFSSGSSSAPDKASDLGIESNNTQANSMSQSLSPSCCQSCSIDSHGCSFDDSSDEECYQRCHHNCAAIASKHIVSVAMVSRLLMCTFCSQLRISFKRNHYFPCWSFNDESRWDKTQRTSVILMCSSVQIHASANRGVWVYDQVSEWSTDHLVYWLKK